MSSGRSEPLDLSRERPATSEDVEALARARRASRELTLADIERLRVPEWLKGRGRERRTSEGWEPFTLE